MGNRFIKQYFNEFEDKFILSTKFHPTNPNIWYVITFENGVYITDDNGYEWRKLSQLKELQKPRILAIDPVDSNNMYLGLRGNGIYRSSDGGESWEWASAGLEFESLVTDIEIDQDNPNILYASIQTSGVYVSNDFGKTWRVMNNGLSHRNINHLALSLDGNTLYAGSMGGGVFRISIHDQVFFDNLVPTPTITLSAIPQQLATLTATEMVSTPNVVATSTVEFNKTPVFSITEDDNSINNSEGTEMKIIIIGGLVMLIFIGGTVFVFRKRLFNDKK